ncbi:hypothetical protein CC86DRAFT_405874 [Ophiobolus disseminans]|uniref:Uncharacterized protein n=1 Tax=Ophiobolus disseminans TaxID=1469910 RepID=A0A6A7A1M6_9PLEO|nr:hypothetical protein CC86DRAFT_405874 [Ophiobolus disseminans]
MITINSYQSVNIGMRIWTSLLSGLHCIFCVEVDNFSQLQRRQRISISLSRLAMIPEHSYRHCDDEERSLFEAARDMSDELQDLDSDDLTIINCISCTQAVRLWEDQFQFHLKPVNWMISEKLIPHALVERGVMTLLTKCSELTDTVKDQALVVNVLNVDDFEEYGNDDDQFSVAESEHTEDENEEDSDSDYVDEEGKTDDEYELWKDDWYCF